MNWLSISEERSLLLVRIYVDDLLITGHPTTNIKEFKRGMTNLFEMTDLSLLSSYLRIQVYQHEGEIMLSHRSYVERILIDFNMEGCNCSQTPLKLRPKFDQQEGVSKFNSSLYRSLMGSLRYLTHTRPDLLFSVGFLCRFMENPTS